MIRIFSSNSTDLNHSSDSSSAGIQYNHHKKKCTPLSVTEKPSNSCSALNYTAAQQNQQKNWCDHLRAPVRVEPGTFSTQHTPALRQPQVPPQWQLSAAEKHLRHWSCCYSPPLFKSTAVTSLHQSACCSFARTQGLQLPLLSLPPPLTFK